MRLTMRPRPEPTEGKQLASKAINLLKDEGISMQEAIETVCSQALVSTTDKPLMIEKVQAYPRLPQDAVTHIVVLDSEDKTLYILDSEDKTLYILDSEDKTLYILDSEDKTLYISVRLKHGKWRPNG